MPASKAQPSILPPNRRWKTIQPRQNRQRIRNRQPDLRRRPVRHRSRRSIQERNPLQWLDRLPSRWSIRQQGLLQQLDQPPDRQSTQLRSPHRGRRKKSRKNIDLGSDYAGKKNGRAGICPRGRFLLPLSFLKSSADPDIARARLRLHHRATAIDIPGHVMLVQAALHHDALRRCYFA